jgi:hypothetical protein
MLLDARLEIVSNRKDVFAQARCSWGADTQVMALVRRNAVSVPSTSCRKPSFSSIVAMGNRLPQAVRFLPSKSYGVEAPILLGFGGTSRAPCAPSFRADVQAAEDFRANWPAVTLIPLGRKLTRGDLARILTPAGTATHKPIPQIEVVEKPTETLRFRQIGIVR